MDLTSVVVGPALKEIYSLARDRLSKRLDTSAPTWQPVFEHLEDYVGEVLRWSSRIQFFGMAEARSTDDATVSLTLSEPRRFRTNLSAKQTIGEADLFTNPHHYVILGDPGSGKSTTLKRLARAILQSEPVSPDDIYRYPVVIRLREHSAATDPDAVVADTVRIPYKLKDKEKKTDEQYLVSGDRRLSDVVPSFLDNANAVLMLDGLDELPQQTRRRFETWSVGLGYRLSSSKIIITSRSGDYSRHLDGFNLLELCPLRPEQTRAIAEKWLPNADAFLNALEILPYHDLADRPLLLSQLMVLFQREDSLPEQPSQVYRRLLRLLLEDWDKERGINRRSRYANFDPDRKADFLGALSYLITYLPRRTTFKLQDLIVIYAQIHRLFGLPANEAEQVAEEIGSHTGLIVVSGDGFEFSHLSFQEYLCAYHMVREPFPEQLERYVAEYPAPLAVAVAISASPANWFAGLILKKAPFKSFTPDALHSFLRRLRLERPLFDVSAGMGIAVMHLLHEYPEGTNIREDLAWLLEDEAVLESLRHGLEFYMVPAREQNRPGEVVLRAFAEMRNHFQHGTPERVALPVPTMVQVLSGKWILVPVDGGSSDFVRMNEQGDLCF